MRVFLMGVAKGLGEEPASEQDLLALLKPCPDEAFEIWPVDKMVGNVKNNGPQLILPVGQAAQSLAAMKAIA